MRPRLGLATIGALIALFVLGHPAAGVGEVATEVRIHPIEDTVVGSGTPIVFELRTSQGTPVAGEALELTLNGEPWRRVRTGPDGAAPVRLPRELAPGSYGLVAVYDGRTDAYLGDSAQTTFRITPYELVIETVPPLPGMTFAVNDRRFEAGSDGVARIAVEAAGDYDVAVFADEWRSGDLRAEFSRWNTELFGPQIRLRLPHSGRLQAGFDMYAPASQRFVDLDGGPVEDERIESITLRSSVGNIYTFPDGSPRDLKASRTVRRPTGLESVDIRYNVDTVEVDGSNVVNAGQQRFYLEGEPWEIELLLFSATLAPHDALLGFRAGDAVEVVYPNGKVERIEADENGELAVQWLARGIYRMRVADAPGWAPAVPVALSRDQEVELRVVTYVDMAIALLAGATIAIGLVHRGRPHLIPNAVGAAWRAVVLLRPSSLRRRAIPVPVAVSGAETPHARPAVLRTIPLPESDAAARPLIAAAPAIAVVRPTVPSPPGAAALTDGPGDDTDEIAPRLQPKRGPLQTAAGQTLQVPTERHSKEPAATRLIRFGASTEAPAVPTPRKPDAIDEGREKARPDRPRDAKGRFISTKGSAGLAARTSTRSASNPSTAEPEAKAEPAAGPAIAASAEPAQRARQATEDGASPRPGSSTATDPRTMRIRTRRIDEEAARPPARPAIDTDSMVAEWRAQLELLGLDGMIENEIEPLGIAAVADEPAFPIHEALSRPSRDRPPAKMEPIPVEGASELCTCGMAMQAGARFCRHCGRPPAKMEPIPVEGASELCTCGMAVQAGARFCRRCGRPLESASTEAGSRSGPPSSAVIVVSTVGSPRSTRGQRTGARRGAR